MYRCGCTGLVLVHHVDGIRVAGPKDVVQFFSKEGLGFRV